MLLFINKAKAFEFANAAVLVGAVIRQCITFSRYCP